MCLSGLPASSITSFFLLVRVCASETAKLRIGSCELADHYDGSGSLYSNCSINVTSESTSDVAAPAAINSSQLMLEMSELRTQLAAATGEVALLTERLKEIEPFSCLDDRFHVTWGGYTYRTLHKALKHGTSTSTAQGEVYKDMPDGYDISPDAAAIVTNVIAAYTWDDWRLCAMDKCYTGGMYPSHERGQINPSARGWQIGTAGADAGKYRIDPSGAAAGGYFRLLIRRECTFPKCKNDKEHVTYDGYTYRTLYKANKHNTSKSIGQEIVYKDMPADYDIAPDDPNIATNVIAAYTWDEWRLCTMDTCYLGGQYPAAERGNANPSQRLWQTDGNGKYRIEPHVPGVSASPGDYFRLLIRRKCA